MLTINCNQTSNPFCNVNVGVKNHNFNIPLILGKYNIMKVMQKFKFMQEFTSSINVEYLHSSLQAKVSVHNCAHAKMQKHVFVAYNWLVVLGLTAL